METLTVIKSKEELIADLEQYFAPFRKQAAEWLEKANGIQVTDESQTELMGEARDARLALRKVRINIENLHKELKADSLMRGQILDEIKRTLVRLIEPIEENLQKQEDFAEEREKERKERLFKDRFALLEPYMGEEARKMALSELDENVFQTILKGCEAKLEQDKAHQIALDEQRKKDEKASKEERAKVEMENAKFRRSLARQEQVLMLGLTWDAGSEVFILKDDKSVVTFDKGEVTSVEDPEWNEMINKRLPVITVIKGRREKVEAKERADRDELTRLKNEQAQRERDDEAEKKRKANEQRKLKRAPDKDKLLLLVEQTCYPKDPGLKDEDAIKLFSDFTKRLKAVGDFIADKAREL